MKCRNISCGREIDDGSKFCPYCGTPQRSVITPEVRGGGRGRPERHSGGSIPFINVAAIFAAVLTFSIILVVTISSGKSYHRKMARAERKTERIERRIRRTERRIGEYERLDPHKYDDLVEEISSRTGKTVPMKLSSNPQGAKIYIDGKYTGRKTPAQINVGEGEEIRIKYRNYTQVFNTGLLSGIMSSAYKADFSCYVRNTERINSKAGSRYDWVEEWMHDFYPYGDVEVTSDPPGAKIYLDGEYIGMKTPSMVNVVGAEKLEVKYRDWVSTKEISPDSYKGLEKYHVDYTPLM